MGKRYFPSPRSEPGSSGSVPLTHSLPFAQICLNATGSKAATTVFVLIPCLLLVNSVRGIVITASRVLMSLGRDNVLLYPELWTKTVHGEPALGLAVTIVVPLLCGLVQLGSASAFASLLGAATIAFELSYGENLLRYRHIHSPQLCPLFLCCWVEGRG